MPTSSNPISKFAIWEGIRMTLLCMLVSLCGLGIVYYLADRALLSELRGHLEDLASLTARQIDAEAHRNIINDAIEPRSPLYKEASLPLLRLREQVPDIYYAYTLTFKESIPIFVLDSSFYIENQGDTTENSMPGEVYDDAPEALMIAWKNERSASSEKPYTDKWGTFIGAFAPIKDASGKVSGIVGIDISMSQLAMNQKPVRLALAFAVLACLIGSGVLGLLRARSHSKLMQHEAELIVARADAERGEKAKSVFLATMSHEIRTPLNGVLGMAEALSQTNLTDEQNEQLLAIQNSGKLLLVMLNDILDFSKIEVGSMSAYSEPIYLPKLVQSAVNLYRASAENKGLELIFESSPDVPQHVLADPNRTSQILGNLLSNAIKFTPRGTICVKISVASEADTMAVISVEDSGIGIPEDRLKDLFIPFSQLDSGLNRLAGGSGLGLSISRRLAELMNGTLKVESHDGKGSCFMLSLPITEAMPAEIKRQKESDIPLLSSAAFRVLVAEDVAVNRQVAGHMLKRLGINPTFAEDGEAAIRLWREQRPDVILMDVHMPHIDGREATRQIRAECGDATNPWIIALTGGVMDDDQEKAFEAGMNDFLAKPINMTKLSAALAKVQSLPSI